MAASGTGAAFSGERPSAVAVLIVDHEDSVRDLCKDVAADAGMHARTASTTEEALQILQQYPVDILIADLRAPPMGGIALLKQVREAYRERP